MKCVIHTCINNSTYAEATKREFYNLVRALGGSRKNERGKPSLHNVPRKNFRCFCGVCLKKLEPILRRTPTNEDAPPPPRGLGGHQRKMFLAFRICARPISSKKERTFFFGVLPSKYSGRWRGDNSIRSGMAEFPPHPPSAMPSLGRTEFSAAALNLIQ